MASEKSVFDFAAEKTRPPKKPKTLLDYDMRRAEELGYGCHYGDYKADHPNTRAEFEATTEKKTPPKKMLTCPICGTKFFRAKSPNQKYCSPECQAKARARQEKASKEARPKPGTSAVCPICKKDFTVGKQRKYCSVECAHAANKENGKRLREKYRQEERENNGSI